MRKDKAKAIILRKNGKSYNEISVLLNIPKSTLSNWFQQTKWSQKTKIRLQIINRQQAQKRMLLLAESRKKERAQLYKKNRVMAKKLYSEHKTDPLFIAGLMIYWGEGDRQLLNGRIRVANTDPYMLRLFYLFIKRFLPEIDEKIKAYTVLYPDLNETTCHAFWSLHIGLPLDKFLKAQYIEGRHPSKRLAYGVCTVYVQSRQHKEMMDEWLQLVKQDNALFAGIV